MEDFHNDTAHAQYDYFSVGSEEDWYELHLGAYSGNTGISLNYHNNMKFSTNDKDNDMLEGNCSHIKLGGWWYEECAAVNLNGKYTENWEQVKSNVYWRSFKGTYPMKSTSMKARGTTGRFYGPHCARVATHTYPSQKSHIPLIGVLYTYFIYLNTVKSSVTP